MACSGCQNRQKALLKMHEAIRAREGQRALKMAGFVGKSMVRDAMRIVSPSSMRKTARPR